MAKVGYIRIRAIDRLKLDRQKVCQSMGVERVFCDIMLATNQVMPNLYDMLQKIKDKDEIIVKSISNLGLTNANLYEILKDLRARKIKVYSQEDDMELTSNEVMKLLGGMKEVNKANQMKGIKKALEKGVKFGREIQYATDEKKLNRVMLDYHRQALSWKDAANKLGIDKKSTFFYRYHKWEEDTGRK